jgi:hypothetical protein
MDVNEHERLSNFTLSIYKLKKKNITFIVVYNSGRLGRDRMLVGFTPLQL